MLVHRSCWVILCIYEIPDTYSNCIRNVITGKINGPGLRIFVSLVVGTNRVPVKLTVQVTTSMVPGPVCKLHTSSKNQPGTSLFYPRLVSGSACKILLQLGLTGYQFTLKQDMT